MYLDFFKLKEHPFRLTPDPEFLYLGREHKRAKTYMDYGIWNREGFVVITGEVGSGKTTLIQKLLSEFDEHVLVAKIFQTQLDDIEFLQAVLVEFGLNPFQAKKAELMDMLSTFLIDNFLKSKQIVLIVDEAQNLSARVLEEIRMLSGLETHKEKILHVILVGQPELNDILDSPGMEQLAQRIRFRFHIHAFDPQELKEYVAHRLRIAGLTQSELFTEDALALVHEYSGGVPRMVNTLCDTALTCAYADEVRRVDAGVVKDAIKELNWVPYSQRGRRRAPVKDFMPTAGKGPGDDGSVGILTEIAERLKSIERLLEHMVIRPEPAKTEPNMDVKEKRSLPRK